MVVFLRRGLIHLDANLLLRARFRIVLRVHLAPYSVVALERVRVLDHFPVLGVVLGAHAETEVAVMCCHLRQAPLCVVLLYHRLPFMMVSFDRQRSCLVDIFEVGGYRVAVAVVDDSGVAAAVGLEEGVAFNVALIFQSSTRQVALVKRMTIWVLYGDICESRQNISSYVTYLNGSGQAEGNTQRQGEDIKERLGRGHHETKKGERLSDQRWENDYGKKK